MSDAVAGRVNDLQISDDGGSTYNAVEELLDASLSLDMDAIDVTSKDSAGWKEFLEGFASGTIDGTCNYIMTSVGQQALLDALTAKSSILIRYRLQTATGAREYTGIKAIVTQFEDAAPLDDASEVSFSLQLSGNATPGPQS